MLAGASHNRLICVPCRAPQLGQRGVPRACSGLSAGRTYIRRLRMHAAQSGLDGPVAMAEAFAACLERRVVPKRLGNV